MNGVITWEQTEKEHYQASVERSTFSIATRDHDGIAPYTFGMYDSVGAPIALIDSNDDEYPEEINREIVELWTVVNTSAAEVLSFLERALHDLDRLPPF